MLNCSVESREHLLSLVKEHIANHIVKIGKNTYRQIVGIPQGSILSTLLCYFFYCDLEKREWANLITDESCLIRYVDDFLFITTDLDVAKEFCTVMHRGFPENGCEVNKTKTLVNFDFQIDGVKIEQIKKYAPHEGLI